VTTPVDQARAVADAVLYEGYVLYPYRASATKNQMRWQFGVLMPPCFADAETGEYDRCRTECLLEPDLHTILHVRVRFLQVQARTVEVGPSHRQVPSLTVADTEYTSWEEAVAHEIEAALPVSDLLAGDNVVPFTVDGGEDVEQLTEQARLVRRRWRLDAQLRLRAYTLSGPYGGVRLTMDVVNTSPWRQSRRPTRQLALRRALIAEHSVLSVFPGRFLSLVDPPEWAKPAVRACHNERTWPVLVGDPDRADTVLSSPIILYDYPTVAEESAGQLYDGTEIDEILTLRTMALTDEEKRQARATDPRSRELVDRIDQMPAELLERLHGTVRYLRSVTGGGEPVQITDRPDVPWWDPGADTSVHPETDSVVIGGVAVARGSRVRLRPGLRRADAQDMFLAGRVATVQSVLLDVDGDRHIAVTLDDDEASDLNAAHGRFRYFSAEEVEPL